MGEMSRMMRESNIERLIVRGIKGLQSMTSDDIRDLYNYLGAEGREELQKEHEAYLAYLGSLPHTGDEFQDEKLDKAVTQIYLRKRRALLKIDKVAKDLSPPLPQKTQKSVPKRTLTPVEKRQEALAKEREDAKRGREMRREWREEPKDRQFWSEVREFCFWHNGYGPNGAECPHIRKCREQGYCQTHAEWAAQFHRYDALPFYKKLFRRNPKTKKENQLFYAQALFMKRLKEEQEAAENARIEATDKEFEVEERALLMFLIAADIGVRQRGPKNKKKEEFIEMVQRWARDFIWRKTMYEHARRGY